MLAFDTDMIGPYGYCADLSRSWTIGHTRMTGEQSTLYSNALAQIEHNTALIRPGMDFREYMEKTWPIPNVISPIAIPARCLVSAWPTNTPARPTRPPPPT